MEIKLLSVVHYYNHETVSSQRDWDYKSNGLDMRMAFILFKLPWTIPFSRDFIGWMHINEHGVNVIPQSILPSTKEIYL